mgnify:CR=1 FL=1
MDMIEILKAVLEIVGGLALIGACVAISVNVKIVIHLEKPRKTRKKSKKYLKLFLQHVREKSLRFQHVVLFM